MGMMSTQNNKKDLNVELNLLPVFDILSVCICFLLMTVVWVQVKTLETKQALGGQAQEDTPSKGQPRVIITMSKTNQVMIVFKSDENARDGISSLIPESNENGNSGEVNWIRVEETLQKMSQMALSKSQNVPLTMAQILPSKATEYKQVIHIMDILKKVGIKNIGLSPI